MSEIPIDFLANCSIRSIEDLMLSSENEAANHRKALRMEIDQMIDAAIKAAFARWMLNHRDEIRKAMESLELPNVLDGRSVGRGVVEELCCPEDKKHGTTKTPK